MGVSGELPGARCTGLLVLHFRFAGRYGQNRRPVYFRLEEPYGIGMTLLDTDKDAKAIGEDTWELFEVIEDSFGVELGDYYELAGITVGQLASRISEQASYAASDRCLSSAAFYRLRKALNSINGVSRIAVRPATSLKKILLWRNRRADWNALEIQLGLVLPKLTFPSWLALLCLISPAVGLVSARVFLGVRLSWFEIMGGSFALIISAMVACIPFARGFPPNCETVGALAKSVLSRNYAAFAAKLGSSSEIGVLSALRLLVAIGTGRGLDEVSAETRIPTDLNIY